MGIEAVLVLLLLVTPGMIADSVYRFLLWRPDPEESARFTRALVLSAAGLLTHLLLADSLPNLIPAPAYLSTAWWQSWSGDLGSAVAIAFPWSIHIGSSVAVAAAACVLMKRKFVANVLRLVAGQSLHRNAWDEFAAANHKHWVFVKLTDGRHYYGELGVASGDRTKDLVLWHPYPFNEHASTYEITGARALFVPAEQVASVLVGAEGSELEQLRPAMGVYNLKTGARIDGQRSAGEPSGAEDKQQQHALGAEGQSHE